MKPERMCLARVRAPRPAEFILFRNRESQIYGPHVITDGFAHPGGARMVEMNWAKSLLVGTLPLGGGYHIERDGEKLMGCGHLGW